MIFFFHYNKPASKQQNRPVISLHYQDRCYLVYNIICNVKTYGKINKRQPFWVMKGNCKEIIIDDDNVATIN